MKIAQCLLMIAALLVVVQSSRVNPALRFLQTKVPDACYVICDCGSSSTKVLMETGKGTKEFDDKGAELARVDCVLDPTQGDCSKAGEPEVATRNLVSIDVYKKQILDQIQARKGSCTKFYIAMFATGGMRKPLPSVVAKQDPDGVKAIAESLKDFTHPIKGDIIASKGAAVLGSLEGFFAVQTALVFHRDIGADLGKVGASVAAVDLGGQTNQFAYEKNGKPCAQAAKTNSEHGTSKDEYTMNQAPNKTYCSQSLMWGLNAFGKEKTAGFNAHQRDQMTAVTDASSRQKSGMVVQSIANWFNFWRTCLGYPPCKTEFIGSAPKIEEKKTGKLTWLKGVKVSDFKAVRDWWDTNVSSKDDAGTMVGTLTEQNEKKNPTGTVPAYGAGNSRLASNLYDTLRTFQGFDDDQMIVPCKSAWNPGATQHLDNKVATDMVTHAGGDDMQFDAFFDSIVDSLSGVQQSAGGDENLADRVSALETKLAALQMQH